MGLQLKDLVVKETITLRQLQGKILAIDSYNILYQFLTSIRSPDGTVLTNSQGQVTSHLIGLFSRTTALMEAGIKVAFVFDGKPPQLKQKTWEKRKAAKKIARQQLQEAILAEDQQSMKKYAARTAKLTTEILNDAKTLIAALGLPIIDAPAEGEAQAAYMVKKGDAFACVSQDYDNLIFNCPTLLRNLSLAGKRKKKGAYGYVTVQPEIIRLSVVLKDLAISHEQLVWLAILMGTDYNPGGIKGIGPKTALKLVKKFPKPELLFSEVEWESHYPDLSWKELITTIVNMPVTDNYALEWKSPDEDQLRKLLVNQFEFSEERISKKLEAIKQLQGKATQKGLSSFF